VNLHVPEYIPFDSIYLDHAATTPVDPIVAEAMLPYFTDNFGNPSSIYQLGQVGRAALDQARTRIALVLRCHPSEILFTGGATESNNLALTGMAWAKRLAGNGTAHIVTTAVEHHAVLHAAEWLRETGFEITVVPSDSTGLVDPDDIRRAIRPETCLISVMYANNETGAIQPVAEIATIARDHDIPVHTDAVQAPGMLPLRVDELEVDLLTLGAHKFYGPKGVGLLYVKTGTRIAYQQHGGGQESGRRGGTENVPLIFGMSLALEIAERDREQYAANCFRLRQMIYDEIVERVEGVELNGPEFGNWRSPNNLNIAVEGVQGETILLNLDMQGVAASAGSACTTGNSQPSHVLKAMGFSDDRCRSSVRLTVGRCNLPQEMAEAAEIFADSVSRIRQLAG
jgi:cysteine desulfurase